jgi:hypothetical protein
VKLIKTKPKMALRFDGKMQRYLCIGITKRGTSCCRSHLKGSPYCKSHGPASTHISPTVLEEDECPVCLDDYIPTIKSLCGHHVCQSCCKSMKESGRTICCPICRDSRFKYYLNSSIVSKVEPGKNSFIIL